MRTLQLARRVAGAVLAALIWATPARAITVEITTKDSSLVGESYHFSANTTDAVGPVQFRWAFGDARTEFLLDQSQMDRVFDKPGQVAVTVWAKDTSGGATDSQTLSHIVHYPLGAKRPVASTTIVYDEPRSRVYCVNQDNDTISAVDAMTLEKVGELAVYHDPEALALGSDGKLWVLHKDDYAIAIVNPDTFEIERGFRLPFASQPIGLVMSPTGDAAYVTLMAVGKLLKLDPNTGEIVAQVDVGPNPRGVSVSGDGTQVFVTRFVSPRSGGEVSQVDAATLTVKNRYVLTPDDTTDDTDQKGRGLPNYLFSVGLSPDGRQAWVAGKKDNIFRGQVDALDLTQDNTVRPMISVLDLSQTTEDQASRLDLDDQDLPTYTEFSPLGDLAFVTITGSNRIEVRDTYTKELKTALTDAGLAPRGTVLGPKQRLFVQGSMERSIVVYDVGSVLDWSDQRSKKIKDIPVVDHEKLAPDVLLGKQVFSNSADGRMTHEGYLTCITCHFDGGEDGQVYAFVSGHDRLRNTISLRGHRGAGQGNLLWSGTFDEVQDIEQEIRGLFLGLGFMSDDAFGQGTRAQALGDPKQGLSKELDALAAYLTSLDHVDPSPFRSPDGSLTPDGIAGRALFSKLGCDFCHSGPDYTDSARGRLHDVGPSRAAGGTGGGAPLTEFDTPSLLGVWQTAPYLHDGSAATLRDVLTTQNPEDQHGFTSGLTPQELDQLVAFLQQIDGDQELRRLPFEPPLPDVGGTAGAGGADGADEVAFPDAPARGCGCVLVSGGDSRSIAWLAFAPLVWYRRCQRRRSRRAMLSR